MKKYNRVLLIVLDSVGIGELPDADQFNDAGAHTLGHIAEKMNGLHMPNMEELGLGNIETVKGIKPIEAPKAAYARMKEVSRGKDTTTGHWEFMGVVTEIPFKTYPDGFPSDLIEQIEKRTGRKVIGNKPASGTVIIDELAEEHMKTGALIVYTSADSVLQIAAHEEVIPIDELYKICEIARELTLDEKYSVVRVIARPFVGTPGNFVRTPNRRDYSVKPPIKTVLNYLAEAGKEVIAIGKISDIYAGEGIVHSVHTKDNMDGVDKILEVAEKEFHGVAFANLVDFDAKFGHRRNPIGYGKALEEFDARLPEILSILKNDDLLIITADHGNDPTHHGTDHTREYTPLIVYSPTFSEGKSLGVRETFADIGATIAENFGVQTPSGTSFLSELPSKK